MPWTYEQNTGRLLTPTGRLLAVGYSGFSHAKNDPSYQTIRMIGPIPQGKWSFALYTPKTTMGPRVLQLLPTSPTNTHGRTGFFIHGDRREAPGGASHGCIILPPAARQRLLDSDDKTLCVVIALPDPDA